MSTILCYSYSRASAETQSIGVTSGERPEPTLEESRAELANALAKSMSLILPMLQNSLLIDFSELAISEALISLENQFFSSREEFNLIVNELLDRLI